MPLERCVCVCVCVFVRDFVGTCVELFANVNRIMWRRGGGEYNLPMCARGWGGILIRQCAYSRRFADVLEVLVHTIDNLASCCTADGTAALVTHCDDLRRQCAFVAVRCLPPLVANHFVLASHKSKCRRKFFSSLSLDSATCAPLEGGS